MIMLYLPLSLPDSLKELENDIFRFVNNNILEVIEHFIDIIDDPYSEGEIESCFPTRYYAKNKEKAIDIIYELRGIVRSNIMYEDLSPIHNYVLYSFLETFVCFEKDLPGIMELKITYRS